jgi:DNA-binding beta-propeller fold protein YncE
MRGRPTNLASPTIPRRIALLVAAACAGLTAGSCGDPVSVIGDIPGLMRIVAGVPDTPGRTAEEQATESLMREPSGLVLDDDGVLYVADGGNARILAVSSSGRLTVLRDDATCTVEPCLREPADIALDPQGRLVVADPAGHRVWRLDPATNESEVLAGTGQTGDTPDGVPALGAPLASPHGVAVDIDGTIYVSESRGARVRTVGADGTLGTVAGTGEAGFAGDGGAAIEARLDFPLGLDLAAGRLYVADAGNQRIRSVDLGGGTIATVAGSGLAGYAGDGGAATDASLRQPTDVAVTEDGQRIYIADTFNHRIRLVRTASGRIETFAGTGDTGYSGELLDAGATSLSGPRGVAASPFGLLFVGDTGHDIVWRVALDF